MIAYPFHLILLARRLALAVLIVTLAGITGARAELRLDITRGRVEPMPIAISTFYGQGGQENQVGRDIAQVVSANLERSGLFRPLDPKALIQDPASLHNQPRFADLKVINAQAMVSGTVQAQADGRLRVEFRLWDVIAEQQMTGLAYFTVPENWRRVAHIISDAIYKRITGEEGYFDTRIVYISENGPADKRIKRLAIMDQDGANHRFLTNGQSIVLTPRFAPNQQSIVYMSYVNNRPAIYVYDIGTGRQRLVVQNASLTFAPRFSPDGRNILFSMAQGGNTDVYRVSSQGGAPQRLTNSPGIDTGGSYSPDGSKIVFESDRSGGQQIYVMNADGSNQQRISFGGGRYATPVWSPRGDLIAFTKLGGGFRIGIMSPSGGGEKLLTNDWQDEGPSWSPNGRVINFFRSGRGGGGKADLWSVDLTGVNERKIPTPLDGSDPAWGPLRP
jgi:TolB protein